MGNPVPLISLLACLALAVPYQLQAQQWSVSGITVPYHDVTLSVSVPGTVSRVLKSEGEVVQAGEPILELRKDLASLQVDRNRLIWQNQAALEEAKERYSTLSSRLERTRQLYQKTHSISEEKLQEDELETKLAKLEVDRLTMAQSQEQVDYEMAQAELERHTVVAPFSGVIVKIFVDLGDFSSPGQSVVRLVDVSRCRLVVHMSAAASRLLRVGSPVRIAIPTISPPNLLTGVVDYMAPVVDPSSGLREIKAAFDNPGGRVLPGLTATLLPP